jgi:hypothetical protein
MIDGHNQLDQRRLVGLPIRSMGTRFSVRRTQSSMHLIQFTLDPGSTGETSHCSHRKMSHTTQCDNKVQEKVEPILHWERPHSAPHDCDTMYEMCNQGLNINHLESDDCPSEDESDAPSLPPHCLSNSVSSSESECDESEYDEFGEEPWDESEFTTYRCNSVKVGHIPSQPTINSHDYEDEMNNAAGIRIHCVTLSKENIYQPKSIHDNTVDLKLSKIACEKCSRKPSTFQPSRTSRLRISSDHNSTSTPYQQLQQVHCLLPLSCEAHQY